MWYNNEVIITNTYTESESMTPFEQFINMLRAPMTRPPMFGVWHLGFLLLTVAACIFAAWKCKDASDKTVRRILLITWISLVIMEIYKQVIFSMRVTYGYAEWQYQWYSFPFQLCSAPLYTLPFLVWLKEGRLRNAIAAYMATFSLFGGLAVMIYPGDVFSDIIGANIQTMLHHGAQIVIGVLMVVRYRRQLNKSFFLGGLITFTFFSTLAMIFNVVVQKALIANQINMVVNMFYISPYHPSTLPVLSAIYPHVPYAVFLLIYLLGFAAVAAVILSVEKAAVFLAGRKRRAN